MTYDRVPSLQHCDLLQQIHLLMITIGVVCCLFMVGVLMSVAFFVGEEGGVGLEQLLGELVYATFGIDALVGFIDFIDYLLKVN